MRKGTFYTIVIGVWVGTTLARVTDRWLWKDSWHDIGTSVTAICSTCIGVLVLGWWYSREQEKQS